MNFNDNFRPLDTSKGLGAASLLFVGSLFVGLAFKRWNTGIPIDPGIMFLVSLASFCFSISDLFGKKSKIRSYLLLYGILIGIFSLTLPNFDIQFFKAPFVTKLADFTTLAAIASPFFVHGINSFRKEPH
ncbi:hypothetical protein [Brevibacillus porteri]|uniref:hypothetical protein n=1 Tax=Brevibacillus porteri TaxID=2126350 RepID=UPI003D196773